MNEYRAITGSDQLLEGCWLKKDRKKNTIIWQNANAFNLTSANGYLKYKTIEQIRDFYEWFDKERIKKGHEIKYIGIAATVASQLSILENYFVRNLLVRDEGVLGFANDASKKVFEFAFYEMREVFELKESLIGTEAEKWDYDYGKNEQCYVLETIYESLPSKTIQKLEKMAKGKGVYYFGVPKELQFEGDIKDCNDRINHAARKIKPYRDRINKNKNLDDQNSREI